jgi:AcrR family transcriptional regulator
LPRASLAHRGERVERRREEILSAASRVFAEKGYRDAGIADIAAELGIGHGTVYRYFENKRDVVAQVVQVVIERIAAIVASEDPETSNTLDEYREQTARIGGRLIDLFADDPALAWLFVHEALAVDEELTARVYAAYDLFAEFTGRYLRNGRDKGFLRADLDIDLTARAINGIVFAMAGQVARPDGGPAPRDAWIQAGASLMFDGLAARVHGH